ncbi:N-carbamoyl-L-amino-acid hydrolase [Actinoplanes lutulentus]|uniref:N-carbamoyl-L-amino-acid hydrolase n=1 Tax=Actinoplanes lutulentus TaxID=1287878 RepID=A0A327Z052_9ACTN|nr:N-carbamoyl-L-amino-acid hydrolase [Actinoplanes lutulentus]
MITSVPSLMSDISGVGRDRARGGYSRFVLTPAELELREWFGGEAARRSLDVEVDRNGVLWAWHSAGSSTGAVVTGSHLDSVPGGGAFDGPLGIATAFCAYDRLLNEGALGDRPFAIAAFPEEEGARFGVACLGSRLMTGAIDPDRARGLTDADGVSYAEALAGAGIDPRHIGPDPDRLKSLSAFVELHVEQGRGLIDLGQPVAVGDAILGHGRWRITVRGQGNHAGTTLMDDRRDPMVAAAAIVVAVRDLARQQPDARATVGRIQPVPGGTNVIASRVEVWLDVRHPSDEVTASLVARIAASASSLAASEGCTASVTEESLSPTVHFDASLRSSLCAALPGAPVLGTGAGHDAGVLGSHVPTGMLFVRNPTGISHAPEEHVEDDDADAGADALARCLAPLLRVAG